MVGFKKSDRCVMILWYQYDKVIVIDGFKNKAISMTVNYDDVDRKKVDKGVREIIKALNAAGL